jgi:hypothetical protein
MVWIISSSLGDDTKGKAAFLVRAALPFMRNDAVFVAKSIHSATLLSILAFGLFQNANNIPPRVNNRNEVPSFNCPKCHSAAIHFGWQISSRAIPVHMF